MSPDNAKEAMELNASEAKIKQSDEVVINALRDATIELRDAKLRAAAAEKRFREVVGAYADHVAPMPSHPDKE